MDILFRQLKPIPFLVNSFMPIFGFSCKNMTRNFSIRHLIWIATYLDRRN